MFGGSPCRGWEAEGVSNGSQEHWDSLRLSLGALHPLPEPQFPHRSSGDARGPGSCGVGDPPPASRSAFAVSAAQSLFVGRRPLGREAGLGVAQRWRPHGVTLFLRYLLRASRSPKSTKPAGALGAASQGLRAACAPACLGDESFIGALLCSFVSLGSMVGFALAHGVSGAFQDRFAGPGLGSMAKKGWQGAC